MILRGESENYHILCINYDQNIILRREMIQNDADKSVDGMPGAATC